MMRLPWMTCFAAAAALAACHGDPAPEQPADAGADAAPLPDGRPDAEPPADAAPDAAHRFVTIAVDGPGSVKIDLRGTSTTCTTTCTIDVTGAGEDELVVTAVPDAHAGFQGWRGCHLEDDDSCRPLGTLSSGTEVTAGFAPLEVHVARALGTSAGSTYVDAAGDGHGDLVVLTAEVSTVNRYYLTSLEPDGGVRWQLECTDPSDACFYGDVAVDASGTVHLLAWKKVGDSTTYEIRHLDGATGTELGASPLLDRPEKLAVSPAGDLAVCTSESLGSYDVVYFDAAGAEVWESGGAGRCTDLAVLPERGLAVRVEQEAGSGIDPSYYSVAFGSDRQIRWTKPLGFGFDLSTGMVLDGTRLIEAFGGTLGPFVGARDLVGGEPAWRLDLESGFFPVTPVLAGDLAVLGATASYSGPVTLGADVVQGHDDAVLFAVDRATGAATLGRRLGGPGSQSAAAVAVGPEGSYWVAGRFYGTWTIGGQTLSASASGDVFVLRVTP